MNEIEIEIVDTQVSQRSPARCFYMFGAMECVPKLRGNPKFFSRAQSRSKRSCNPLAHLALITVIGGAVEMSIARSDSRIHSLGGSFALNFPKSEPNCGHNFAIDSERCSFTYAH